MSVESDPVAFATSDRFWRVELATPEGREPTLEVSWQPAELVFLGQGRAPYLLAYGRADFAGRQWPMADLVSRLPDVNGARVDLSAAPLAQMSEPNMLGGPSRLVAATKPIDWMTIVLWAVLVAGVALIGTLATRLLRQ